LQTARTINGVSFNGSANITVADSTKLPLTGGTLTGALVVPYLNIAEPVENFNPFGQFKMQDGILSNALVGRWDRFDVTIDGTLEPGASIKLSNQNFEEYNQNRLFGTDAGETKVFNVNVQKLATGNVNSNGITYCAGYFDLCFYSTPFPASWSARVKNRDGNWTTVTSFTKIGNSKLRGVIPIGNYLTDIEFTLVARTSAPYVTGNITYGLAEFELFFSRMVASQGGNISSLGGYLGGTITTNSGITSTNWNTAYGWGNHASQGYATQTYVNTAVSNLVSSAPGTLDTLNELAAALGDDPNFATTVTNSIAGKLSLAGGTMTGDIIFNNNIRLEYSTTHWITPRDSSGNMHLRTSSGGIYLDAPVIYFREVGSEGNSITVDNGTLTATGIITATGGNSTNWNTAYGWGNHASAGYSLTSHNHSGVYLPISGKASDSELLDGIDSTNVIHGNAKGTNDSVTTDADGLDKTGYYTSSAFVTKPSGVSNWMYIEHIKLYNSNTGYQKQLGYDTYDNRMWVRTKNNSTWTSWKQIWTEDVFANNSSNWNTAYGWGNHASAGYLTTYTDTNTTYTAGAGLTLTGTVFSHTDTSSQASVNNSGRTYIQDITLDAYGHITGITSATETVVNTDTNTTYTAGTGLSLTGTVFANTAPNIVQTTVSGNAGTATTLQTARTIAGVSFDGSANISLNNNAITNGAGYITSYVNTTYTAGTGLSLTGTVFANTAPNIVQTTVSGNAGSATVLQTARTIAGVSFNGSANISLNNNAITNGAGYTTSVGTITGSGTANYIPKLTTTTALGNSLIYDNGTNVGIGTTTPGAKLEVIGSFNVKNASLAITHFNYNDTSVNYVRGVTNFDTNPVYFTGGNIGIGTTTPTEKLDVSGVVNATSFSAGGTAGFTGTVTIAGNPPGSQTLDFQGGLLVSVS